MSYRPKIYAKRTKMFCHTNTGAYGYPICYLNLGGKKFFLITHNSILAKIEFKTLKDAILTAKMNEGTHIKRGTKLMRYSA